MNAKLSRLRAGEWLTAVSVVLMVVALFALHWSGGRTGWQAVTHLRWLLLIALLPGAALAIAQAAFRAPAIPATLDVICTVLAIPTVLWLILRVVIDPGADEQVGAWLELLGALGLLVGSFLALRQEGIREDDGPGEIPLVDLAAAARPHTGGPAPSA
jgi:hypothetical protein